MNDVDVDAVDRGDELRQGVEFFLGISPVIVAAPVSDEILNPRQLDALGNIVNGFLIRPARIPDPRLEVVNRD